ncbi:MAG: discoidin domain-containing protein [Firmicutes bacterium]|nr:discoidin domain-containing protein [Bacillota bacterium]
MINVTLRAPADISQIVMNGPPGMIWGFMNVSVSADGVNYTPVGRIGDWTWSNKPSLDIFPAVSGRYIRFSNAAYSGINTNLIEVYATPPAILTPCTISSATATVIADDGTGAGPITTTDITAQANSGGDSNNVAWLSGTAGSNDHDGDIVINVTLSAPADISQIVMNGPPGMIWGFMNVSISADGVNYTPVGRIGDWTWNPTLDISPAVTGQYIRFVSQAYAGINVNTIQALKAGSPPTGPYSIVPIDMSGIVGMACYNYPIPAASIFNNDSTASFSQGTNTYGQYITLDMAMPQTFDRMTLSVLAGTQFQADISVSNDGVAWTPVATTAAATGFNIPTSATGPQTVTFHTQTARYIRLSNFGWGALRVYNVAVSDAGAALPATGWSMTSHSAFDLSAAQLTGAGWTAPLLASTKDWMYINLGKAYDIADIKLACGPNASGTYNVVYTSFSDYQAPTNAPVGQITLQPNTTQTFSLSAPSGIKNAIVWLIPTSDNCVMNLKGFAADSFEQTSAPPQAVVGNPTILSLSEGVAPGHPFSIYGDGFCDINGIVSGDVMVKIGTQVIAPVTANRQVVTAILPATLAPGCYPVMISVDGGTTWYGDSAGNALMINPTDPRWASDDAGYPGMTLSIMGRGLDASAVGGAQKTQVRLNNGAEAYAAAVTSVSPYRVDVVLPNAPTGNYSIEVSTGAANSAWTALRDYPNTDAKVFAMQATPTDTGSLALGVSWSNQFNWSNVINAGLAPYNAVGDGVTDSTAAIQSAVNAAAAAGGGVVFLPAGVYVFGGLSLGKGVILSGAGDTTKLMFYVANPVPGKQYDAVWSDGGGTAATAVTPDTAAAVGCNGLQNLYLGVLNNEDIKVKAVDFGLPGSYIWTQLLYSRNPDDTAPDPDDLGSFSSVITAKYLFVDHCTIDFGLDSARIGKYSGFNFGGSNVLFRDNKVTVPGNVMWNSYVPYRGMLIDNTFDYANDTITFSSEKCFISGNTVTGHNDPNYASVNKNLHGFFVDEQNFGFDIWNFYVGKNSVNNVGSSNADGTLGNDGEAIALDSFDSHFFGTVGESTSTSISGEVNFTPSVSYMCDSTTQEMIAVVGGTGAGQLRQVQSFTADDTLFTVNVTQPWDIQPDATSIVIEGRFHTNVTIERNTINNAAYGVDMYNGCWDCVGADNVINNAGGTIIYGTYNFPSIGSMGPSFFCQLVGNTVTGTSRTLPTGQSWIGLRTESHDTPAYGMCAYGNEFRNNVVNRAGNPSKVTSVGLADCNQPAAYYITDQGGRPLTDTSIHVLGTLFDSNSVLNSDIGLYIQKPSMHSTDVFNMTVANTTTPYMDAGTNTYIADNVRGLTLDQSALSLSVGSSQKLTAVFQPSGAVNADAVWTSGNPSVATVGSDGTVTAVAAGNVTITAMTDDGVYTGTCIVTVTVTAHTLTCTVKSMAAKIGKPLAIPYSWDGPVGALSFTSSNPAVCSVTNAGILSPLKAGIAVITIAAPDGTKVVFAVTVTA